MSPRRSRLRSRNQLSTVLVILLIIVVAYYLRSPSGFNIPAGITLEPPVISLVTPTVSASPQPAQATVEIGKRTKTSGCQISGSLPDPACTPGAVFDATTEQVCTPGYATSVRNVPQSVKDDVYAEYGITSRTPGQYQVDHLISLQLGGSNDIANIWPSPADPKPGYHEKDKIEDYLHDQVCSGKMSLQEAQQQIATNWISVYNSMPK